MDYKMKRKKDRGLPAIEERRQEIKIRPERRDICIVRSKQSRTEESKQWDDSVRTLGIWMI